MGRRLPNYPRPLRELLWTDSNAVTARYLYAYDLPSEDRCHSLLRSVTGPDGRTTTYGYDAATSELTTVTLPTDGELGYQYQSHPFQFTGGTESTRVVSSRRQTFTDNFGVPQNNVWTYTYPAGTASERTTVRTSPLVGFVTEYDSYNYTDASYLAGLPKAERAKDDGNVLSESTNEYVAYNYGEDASDDPVIVALPKRATLRLAGDPDMTSIREYSYSCEGTACSNYDDYGRPTEIRDFEFAPSGGAPPMRRLELQYYHGLDADNIVGRPSNVKLRDNPGNIFRDTSYTYYSSGAKGKLQTITRLHQTLGLGSVAGFATRDLQYDATGNLTRTTDSRGSSPLITNYDYSEGRVSKVYRQNDPALTDVTRTIDPNTGVVADSTDRNNNTWAYDYDGANRMTAQTVPGAYDPATHEYDPNGTSRRTTSGSTEQYAEFDQLGRSSVSRVLVLAIVGQPPRYTYHQVGYDAEGRIDRRYEPSPSIPAIGFAHTKFTFDALGRIKTSMGVGTDEGTSTFSYDANAKVVQPPVGPPRREVYSALGWLLSARDPDLNTTTYTYNAAGDLLTVDAPPGVRDRVRTYNQLGFLLSDDSPEGGLTGYRYDETGNLLERLDADGITSTWTYDYKNRLTSETHGTPMPIVKTYAYDNAATLNGQNRLTSISVPAWSSTIAINSYDVLGNVTRKTETVNGVTVQTDYSYTSQGMVDTITYPHGLGLPATTWVDYDYNDANLPTSIKRNGALLITGIEYDDALGMKKVTYLGGFQLERETDEDSRYKPKRIWSTGANFNLDLSAYTYDDDATIQSITTNGRFDTFEYDDFRRLDHVQYGPNPIDSVDFTYDPNGNFLQRATTQPTWMMLPNFNFTTTPTDRNRFPAPHAYTNTGRLTNDNTGNLFGYGPDGELLLLSRPGATVAYRYNGVGERVGRTVTTGGGAGGQSTLEELYFHDQSGDLLSMFDRSSPVLPAYSRLDFIRANGQLLYTAEHNPQPYPPPQPKYELAYANDHLGSARSVVVLRENGTPSNQTYKEFEFFPYGYMKSDVTRKFYLPGTEPRVPVGFQGHLKEPGTNLWYFKARYLHSGMGRFLTTDPMEDVDPSRPFTWNRYAFVQGNPMSFIDPEGTRGQGFDSSDLDLQGAAAKWLTGTISNVVQFVSDHAYPEPPTQTVDLGSGPVQAKIIAGTVVVGPGGLGRAAARNVFEAGVAIRGGATNRAAFEAYKDLLRAQMGQPAATNSELRSLLDKLYRPNAQVGSGSTAAAVRQELATGQSVGGKFHSQKAQDSIRALQRWLKNNPTAAGGDQAAAENVIKDMQNALDGR